MENNIENNKENNKFELIKKTSNIDFFKRYKILFHFFKKNILTISIHFFFSTLKIIISSLLSWILTNILLKKENQIGEGYDFSSKLKESIYFPWPLNIILKNKIDFNDLFKFLFFLILFLSIVYYIDNEIEESLRIKSRFLIEKKILDKFRKLPFVKKDENKSHLTNLIENDARDFSNYWEHIFNHVYHNVLLIIITLYSQLKKIWIEKEKNNKGKTEILTSSENNNINLIFFLNLFIILIINSLFQSLITKKRIEYRNLITKKISVIRKEINNINLIENMGLIDDYRKKQIKMSKELLDFNLNFSKIRIFGESIIYKFSFELFPIITWYLNEKSFDLDVYSNFFTFINGIGEVIKSLSKEFPDFNISLGRINDFLQLPEQDEDIELKLIDIDKKIISIEFINVNFSYLINDEKNNNKIIEKKILINYNKIFSNNILNKLEGRNGSGKSTIIYLLIGSLEPSSGKILITDEEKNVYDLRKINKKKWKENNVGFCSYENLLENSDGSTGQKQLMNIEETLERKKNAQILIFDEASNALDDKNKIIFLEKIKKLSKEGKMILYIDHIE